MQRNLQRGWFFLLFTASGFAGLIYESIWSHYLKLFLGHAAYAQTLVLAIFMGGMALGSWVCSKYSGKWRNLLLGYALAEGIIGVLALVFHPVFEAVTDFSYVSIMPLLGSPLTVTVYKWILSALLILPQSILLGMTFPLMSAAIIRLFPGNPGSSIAMLYFTNSLGAAVGVLVSGFVLIAWVGLPGTILTAGLINIVLALIVWLLAKTSSLNAPIPAARERGVSEQKGDARYRLLLLVALLTGASSFMYEIGWIRMLNMVLGSSTHAFEIMLSAFILGLAFGGLWIKRRIDNTGETLQFLGVVQVVMGLMALATLVLYGRSFEAMQVILKTLSKTDSGYIAFNFASHFISLAIMFPAAFCAGMTLPLITNALLKQGSGEKSIGAVYAANTIGAILGVFAAIHLGMPLLGLKGLITFGAAIDIILGLALLWRVVESKPMSKPGFKLRVVPIMATVVGVVAVVGSLLWVELDTLKMASGVYRHGELFTPQGSQLLFHQDGKTATVDMVRTSNSTSIRTNGKSDAAINLVDGTQPSPDEITMIMTAALPLAMRPDARTAAVIGFGSGLTSQSLLSNPGLTEVDTMEIEAAMVEAANGFRPRVEAVFSDVRSRIFIDDAKTFFSTHAKKYDIIVSEPSNPWVSGVSSLFSHEFYRLIGRHLQEDGLLVQWIQLYEIEPTLIASILQALGANFSNYVIYATDNSNLLIVATNGSSALVAKPELFKMPLLAKELERVRIRNLADIEVRRIGGKKLLHPLFASFSIQSNSDYFPVLDLNAPRSMFLKRAAVDLVTMRGTAVPTLAMLDRAVLPDMGETTPVDHEVFYRVWASHAARSIHNELLAGKEEWHAQLPLPLKKDIALSRLALSCAKEGNAKGNDILFDALFNLSGATAPHLAPGQMDVIWQSIELSPCQRILPPAQKTWIALFKAVSRHDAPSMVRWAEALLSQETDPARLEYLLVAAMTGSLAQGNLQRSLELWNKFSPQALQGKEPSLLLRLLYGHSLAAMQHDKIRQF